MRIKFNFKLISILIIYSSITIFCNKKSIIKESQIPVIDCNFPPSQSEFGYSYVLVGNQYKEPCYSDEKIVCNYLDTDPFIKSILIIDKSKNIIPIINSNAIGKVAFFNTKFLYTDSKNSVSYLYDIVTSKSVSFETGKTFFCTEFSFSPNGSKFVYKAENKNDLRNSYIFIRDSNLVKIDSINYFDLALETWTKITWINEHVLIFAFEGNNQNNGIKLFDLNKRQVETIFTSTITNSKDLIRSLDYSSLMECAFFCDGKYIYKINLPNSSLNKIKSSCDSLEYYSLSNYTPNLLLVDKITRTKKDEMNIDEKHSLYSLDPITLEEKLIIQ